MHHDLEVLSDVLEGIQATLPIGPEPLLPGQLRAIVLQYSEALTVINRVLLQTEKRLNVLEKTSGVFL